jgi:hypothetical protein
MDPNFGSSWSTAALNNLNVQETNELLPAASTRFASSSTIKVTSPTTATLSIANGSSASAPQYVRFNPRSRAVTSAVTLTITGGSGSGVVNIYAYLTASNALEWLVEDTAGLTYTAPANGVVVADPGFQPANYSNLTLLWSWIVTSGAFATAGGTLNGGTDQQLSTDCWVDAIEVSNITSSAATLTATDGQTTPIQLFDAVSIPGNSCSSYIHPGGRFFDGGLFLTAGSASALQVNVRLARLRRTQSNP